MPASRARHRRAAVSSIRIRTRLAAAIAAFGLLTAGLVVGLPVSPAVAAYPVTVEVQTDQGVLAGDSTAVAITAANPGTDDLYNLSYRYVVPAGVSYVGGSTQPDTAPDPQVVPVYDVGQQPAVLLYTVLLWSNVSDLPPAARAELRFTLRADPERYPVGATIVPTDAGVYANSSPRIVPRFDTTGTPMDATFDAADTETPPPPTSVSALRITKAEPSPESELLRGAHDQSTTYTLTVRNTTQGVTNDVRVVDYLPAGLEFLGCGGVDNSAAGTEEYPGSGRLTSVPSPAGAAGDCRTPYSVRTVVDPLPGLSGVYTEVSWRLGDFAAGQSTTIAYRAGIPLFANTADWPAPAPATDGLDLRQAANLDNNTGASTRHVGETAGLSNRAVASGYYLGAVQEGASREQVSSASESVQASDLSVLKSASTTTFSAGEEVVFSLRLRAGEYADLAELVVVDTIPDGLCPLVPDLAAVLDPASIPVADECYTPRAVDGAVVQSVLANADGTFTVTMLPSPAELAADGTATVGYRSLMRTAYQGVSRPTVAGDAFTNSVVLDGASADVTGRQTPVVVELTDDSRATLGSESPAIDKRVLPRPVGSGPVDCAAHAGEYVDDAVPAYRLGDTVCFELIVDFSDSTVTRNAQLQDFVPTGSGFEGFAVGAASTVPAEQVVLSTADGGEDSPMFLLGAVAGEERFVAKGAVLVLYVWALVESSPVSGEVDITANLMKYRQESTAGVVIALRDQADYGVAPAATMGVDKAITGTSNPVPGSADSQSVQGGDWVDFTIEVANTGSVFDGNAFPVQDVAVWDALPAGFDCTTVSAVTGGGVCTDPDDDGHPVFDGSDARSAIVWTIPGTLEPAASSAVTYRITAPQGLGVQQTFRNEASIVAFGSPNTSGGITRYYPEDSLDPSHQANTLAANDFGTLTVPGVTTAKTATPNLTIPGKSATQVVAGETVRYAYSVTVPRGTAVFGGVLSDVLPTGLSIPADAVVTGDLDGGALPDGFALDAAGRLTFPAVYRNTSAADQVFTVTFDRVLVGVGLASGTLTNTARFASTVSPGGSALPPVERTASVGVVAPAPTITKTASPATVVIGQTVTYTIGIANPASRPTAYDPVVVDCLPGALDFVAFGSMPTGTVTSSAAGDGSNGCAVGTRRLSWDLADSVLTAGAPAIVLTFTATIGNAAAGLVPISNTATLTASTLDNGVNDAALELVLRPTSTAATVTVQGVTTTKTLLSPTGTTPRATVGETLRYRITVVLPAKVNFYKAFVQDTLPGSGSTPYLTGIGNVTVTCAAAAPAPSTDCAADLPAGGSAMTQSGRSAGWYLGDVTTRDWQRTVTIEFDAVVADVSGNIRDTDLQNQARVRWRDAVSGAAPANAAATLDRNGPLASATTVNVKLPQLTIAKDSYDAAGKPDTTIEPGQVITYRVAVANPTNTYGSTAFDATVVDTVPAGIVVDEASLTASGGVLGTSGGNTTITWTLPDLADAASWSAEYTAVLAASSTLTGAALTNTARIPSYRSMDGAGRTFAAVQDGATITPVFPAVTVSNAVAAGTLAYVGDAFGWTVTLTNGGAGTAASVTPTDTLPQNWTYNDDATITIGDATRPFAPTGVSGGVISWPSIGALAPGASAVIRYTATPQADALTAPGSGSGVDHINTAAAVSTDATGATGRGTPAVPYTGDAASATAHLDEADVAITKLADESLVAGTTTGSAWRITVSNRGADVAVGPFAVTNVPTQPLPTGVTVVSAQGTGWSCTVPDAVTGAFECARSNAGDTLASGSSFPEITVTVAVAAAVPSGTEVANVVGVAARTFDPDLENNESQVSTLVIGTEADLELTKTVPGTLTAGQTATWSIQVSNAGPSLARYPVTVTDTLPEGIELDSVAASGTGWACDPVEDGTLTCAYAGTPGGGLAVGSLPSLTVTALVLSSTTDPVINVAEVQSPTPDPVPTNNIGSSDGTVDADTVLTLAKTLLTDPFVPGTEATYALLVTNTGTADARDVAIADSLPAGLSFVSSSGTGWDCDAEPGDTDVSCALDGTLAGSGGTSTLQLTVAVDSAVTGDVVNTATVSWDPDGSASDDDDSGVTGRADFSIEKAQTAGPVVAGTAHEYTLTVGNLGPSDSPAGVTVIDTVPVGLTPTAVTAPEGWECDPIEGRTISCASVEPIAAGAPAALFTVAVDVPADGGPATYRNTATVDGVLTDPVPANDSSSVDTVVSDQADITIVKSVHDDATTVTAGTPITWDLAITNHGPSVADSVTVTDVLPIGFTGAVFTAPDGWVCTASGCRLAAMPLGSATITVTATASSALLPGSEHTNTGLVSWVDSDGVQNDGSSVAVSIETSADLTLSKTPDAQAAVAGAPVAFTLTVGNTGPSDAAAPITVVDTLPPGLRFAGSGEGWACAADEVEAADEQTVTCLLEGGLTGIAAGGTASALVLTTASDPSLPAGTLTNSATATSPTDPESAADTADVTFSRSADLAIVKRHDPAAVQVGSELQFELSVTDAGPSTATGLVVTDTLPTGLEYVDADGSDEAWSCSADGQVVTCALAPELGRGATAPVLLLTTLVTARAYPAVVNTATVRSDVTDPDPDDNGARDEVAVPPSVRLSVEKTHLGEVRIGERASYLITVGNSGPTEEPGDFRIVDELPDGLRFVESSGDAVTCAADEQVVTCEFDEPLPVDGERSVTLGVEVLPGAPDEIVNTVTAFSPHELGAATVEADDSAQVLPAHPLAFTGLGAGLGALGALAALLLGLGLALRRRRIRPAA